MTLQELINRVKNTNSNYLMFMGDVSDKTSEELEKIFAAIPESVRHLGLANNELGRKTGAELAQAFAAIPESVRHLSLTDNELWMKTGAELAQAFVAIPESVTSIDLGSNKLSDEQLIQILISLPARVNKINFWDSNPYKISDHVEHQMTVAKNHFKLLEKIIMNDYLSLSDKDLGIRSIANSTRLGVPEEKLIMILDKITQDTKYSHAYFSLNNIVANLIESLAMDLMMLNRSRAIQYFAWLHENANGLTSNSSEDFYKDYYDEHKQAIDASRDPDPSGPQHKKRRYTP